MDGPEQKIGSDHEWAGEPTDEGAAVLERALTLPGGPELIALAERRGGGIELIGGAVRDLMLGVRPRELDVVVESDVASLAAELARELSADVTVHERFGTALVESERGTIDLATARSESYPAPGALPEIAPGSPEEDLHRRDFTVNAIAVALAGPRRATIRSPAGALEDLAQRRLRVLHDASFRDDPTRLLRLARYVARLGFEAEPHTAALAEEALAGGALDTVSGPRLGAELRLAFAEPDPVASLAELDLIGVLPAWEPGISFDEHVVRTALGILPEDGSARVLLAGSLLLELCGRLGEEETEPAMRDFLRDLELPSREGDRAFGVAVSAAYAIDHIGNTDTTAELLELTVGTPIESLALAAAVRELEDGPGSYGRRLIEGWLNEQRHVELEVTGDDLIAAGVPQGPEIGVRLEESYRLLLEERIEPGREAELRAALEAKV